MSSAPTISVTFKARQPFIDMVAGNVPRFYVAVCHRRAGKTFASLQRLINAALSAERKHSRYGFVAPLRTQAKAIGWDYVKRFSRQACKPLEPAINEAELRIDFPNSSRIQLAGADNPDAIRGGYYDGCVLDEYAQMDPRTWTEVIRPMLMDRHGWGQFIGTPRGRNAFFRLWRDAQDQEDWGRLMLKASESGIISELEIAAARRAMSPEEFLQEMECSFTSASKGHYYGALMEQLEARGQITRVPYDPSLPCVTTWDLGMRDATAIWILQPAPGGAINAIDYIEGSGVGLDWYAEELRSKGYRYTQHVAPADIMVKELGTGRSRFEVAQKLGIFFTVCNQHRVEDGINAVRMLLPRMWIDREKCERGIEALQLYRQEWDSKLQSFRKAPLHDWTSHAADALRYGAMTPFEVSYDDWDEPTAINIGVI